MTRHVVNPAKPNDRLTRILQLHGAWMTDPQLPSQIRQIEFNNEGVRTVVFGLATECHEFAASRGVTQHPVDGYLSVVLSVLDGQFGDLLDVSDVVARGATDIAGIQIRFSEEGYLRLAEAAKDRVALSINGDRDGF